MPLLSSPSKEKDEKIEQENTIVRSDVSSKSPPRAASSKDQKEALSSRTPERLVPKEVSDAASLWLESAKANDTHKPATSSKPVTVSFFD